MAARPPATGPGRPLRVLHVAPTVSLTYGGPAKACLDTAKAVAARGHEVDVYTSNYDGVGHFTSDGDGEPHEAGGGVRVREFRVGPINYRHLSPTFARALRDDVAGYDVVHVHEKSTSSRRSPPPTTARPRACPSCSSRTAASTRSCTGATAAGSTSWSWRCCAGSRGGRR